MASYGDNRYQCCDGCGRDADGEVYCGDCIADVGAKLAAAEARADAAEAELARLRRESAEAFFGWTDTGESKWASIPQ